MHWRTCYYKTFVVLIENAALLLDTNGLCLDENMFLCFFFFLYFTAPSSIQLLFKSCRRISKHCRIFFLAVTREKKDVKRRSGARSPVFVTVCGCLFLVTTPTPFTYTHLLLQWFYQHMWRYLERKFFMVNMFCLQWGWWKRVMFSFS